MNDNIIVEVRKFDKASGSYVYHIGLYGEKKDNDRLSENNQDMIVLEIDYGNNALSDNEVREKLTDLGYSYRFVFERCSMRFYCQGFLSNHEPLPDKDNKRIRSGIESNILFNGLKLNNYNVALLLIGIGNEWKIFDGHKKHHANSESFYKKLIDSNIVEQLLLDQSIGNDNDSFNILSF